MATYLYSTAVTANAATLAFTTSDSLIIDNEAITAASISITGTSTATITAGSNTYTLTSFDIQKISSTNFLFADGSKLQIGDGTTATTSDSLANTIVGTAYNDYLDGQLGSDTVSYAAATSGVAINLSGTTVSSGFVLADGTTSVTVGSTAGDAGVDKLTSIENAIGSAYNDCLIAAAGGSTLDGGAGIDTLIGGAGNDTFIVTAGDSVIPGASPGTDTVISSVNYTLPTGVTNLTLAAGTAIYGTGNSAANTITGNTGNNVLADGGTTADTMIGSGGNDTYLVTVATDTITESANAGTDIILTTVSLTGALPANVENLRLMAGTINGTGNSSNNIIYASSALNALDGGNGTDTVSFQYGAGVGLGVTASLSTSTTVATTISGGSGNDTLLNFENIIGSRYSDSLTGTTGANLLAGGAGNDTLVSGGGVDTLDGGPGNDTYTVLTTTGITFADSAGIDTVSSSGTASISSAATLENLTLTGTSSIDGVGNASANTLVGNSGSNLLDGGPGNDVIYGGGGGGTDIFNGGTGNDTYIIVSASLETINESDNSGTDLIYTDLATATPVTMASGVEYLTIASVSISSLGAVVIGIPANGASSLSGATVTGNSLNNYIIGGAGTDVLNGSDGNDTVIGNAGDDALNGGLGNDSLVGGLGNDTYTVDSTSDIVVEAATSGTDTVKSSVTYTLGVTLENLTLIGTAAGTTADTDLINGTGNTLPNTITGNSGANTLSGLGGADVITGGNGIDAITVGTTGDADSDTVSLSGILVDTNRDTISGFTAGAVNSDIIQIAALDTTLSTADDSAPVVTTDTSAAGTGTAYLLTGVTTQTADIIVLQNGASLPTAVNKGGDLSSATDGTALLKALTDTTVAGDTYTSITTTVSDVGYMLAYQGGAAYLYHYANTASDATLTASEISLVGTLNSITTSNPLLQANFDLV